MFFTVSLDPVLRQLLPVNHRFVVLCHCYALNIAEEQFLSISTFPLSLETRR